MQAMDQDEDVVQRLIGATMKLMIGVSSTSLLSKKKEHGKDKELKLKRINYLYLWYWNDSLTSCEKRR